MYKTTTKISFLSNPTETEERKGNLEEVRLGKFRPPIFLPAASSWGLDYQVLSSISLCRVRASDTHLKGDIITTPRPL